MYDRILRNVAKGAIPVMLTASLASLFSQPIGILHYIVWGLTVLTIAVSWLGIKTTPREYLGRKELEGNRSSAPGVSAKLTAASTTARPRLILA